MHKHCARQPPSHQATRWLARPPPHPPAPHPMPQPPAAIPTPNALPGLRCFLVEDSSVIRYNLIATLEEMLPMRVVGFAEDEYAAERWMASSGTECDLLIIDIFLKAGTGLQVLQQAGVLCPAARRVVLTNYATPAMRRRCLQLGAHRVFDKSSELDELLHYCAGLAPPRPN